MENTAAISPINKPLLRLWIVIVSIAGLAAVTLTGIDTLNYSPGVRRTFSTMILPYAIVAAGILCPLFYAASNHLRSRQIPTVAIAVFLLMSVAAGSTLIGWVYFQWVIPAPRAPFPVWKFLSKELIGISLPFWIILLSIWLWDMRKQVLLLRNKIKPAKSEVSPTVPEKIKATYGKDQYLLNPEDIQFIKAEGNYCKIYSEDRFYLHSASLKNIEQQPYGLIRIHRSTMVNPDFVSSTRSAGHGDLLVILRSGEELKCSRNYSKALKAVLIS